MELLEIFRKGKGSGLVVNSDTANHLAVGSPGVVLGLRYYCDLSCRAREHIEHGSLTGRADRGIRARTGKAVIGIAERCWPGECVIARIVSDIFRRYQLQLCL